MDSGSRVTADAECHRPLCGDTRKVIHRAVRIGQVTRGRAVRQPPAAGRRCAAQPVVLESLFQQLLKRVPPRRAAGTLGFSALVY